MANLRSFSAPLSRITTPSLASTRPSIPQLVTRSFSQSSQRSAKAPVKKKKARKTFIQHDIDKDQQFYLVDAMHYLRAFEVGRDPASSKYELHVRLRTLKNGPILRNRLRLPHPVKTDMRICVIAPPDSKAAAEAKAAGAALVGEEDIFKQIQEGAEGILDYDRYVCHTDSMQKMQKAVGRILGPKRLMPSTRTGTVVGNVGQTVRNMVGAVEYRERNAVVQIPIGQLGHSPDAVSANIKAFFALLKKDAAKLEERTNKEIHEVVLSSTNGPGFSLNGEFRGPESISPKELSGPL